MKKNRLKTRPRNKARTLKKDENLRDSDCCFICGGIADGVRRRGSRYSPVCFDCIRAHRDPYEQHLAEQVETLVKNSSQKDVSDLVADIVFDLQNEVGISVDHPGLIRFFLLAAFEELKNPEPELSLRSYERAERMVGDITELLNGCSPRRFKNIHKQYHPELKEGVSHAAN